MASNTTFDINDHYSKFMVCVEATILDKSNEKLRPPFSSIAMMEKCFARFALR